ncbi:MAG: hypothetical protein NT116_06240 [Candidatus Parcubacteria bacterium]|nr:hypothetical protein [Candidatus Parcubacteria bacterium]
MKNLIVFIVLALILSAAVGTVVYVWQNFNLNNLQIVKQSLESQINTMQNQIAESDKKNSDLQNQLNSLINKPAEVNTNNSAVNVNSNDRIFGEGQAYKYQLTIPQDWQDVIVTEKKSSSPPNNIFNKSEVIYSFSLIAPKTKEKVDIFDITVWKNDIWEEVKKVDMPIPTLISSDAQYTFTYGHRLDWDLNWGFPTTLTPYTSIIKTFKKL